MSLTLTINKPKNRWRAFKDACSTGITTLVSTGIIIASNFLSGAATIPIIALGFSSFLIEQIKNILNYRKMININNSELTIFNNRFHNLNEIGAVFEQRIDEFQPILPEARQWKKEIILEDKSKVKIIYEPSSSKVIISFDNFSIEWVGGDQIYSAIETDRNGINIIKEIINMDNPIRIRVDSCPYYLDSATMRLRTKSFYGDSLINFPANWLTILATACALASMIFAIIAMTQRDNNDSSFDANQDENTSLWAGIVSTILAASAGLIEPVKHFFIKLNLYNREPIVGNTLLSNLNIFGNPTALQPSAPPGPGPSSQGPQEPHEGNRQKQSFSQVIVRLKDNMDKLNEDNENALNALREFNESLETNVDPERVKQIKDEIISRIERENQQRRAMEEMLKQRTEVYRPAATSSTIANNQQQRSEEQRVRMTI